MNLQRLSYIQLFKSKDCSRTSGFLSILIKHTLLIGKQTRLATDPRAASELAVSEAHSCPAALWSSQQGAGNNASMHEQVQWWPTFLCCAVVTVRINAAQQSRLDKRGIYMFEREREEEDSEGLPSVHISFHIQTDSVWFTWNSRPQKGLNPADIKYLSIPDTSTKTLTQTIFHKQHTHRRSRSEAEESSSSLMFLLNEVHTGAHLRSSGCCSRDCSIKGKRSFPTLHFNPETGLCEMTWETQRLISTEQVWEVL